jgi:hypothetical protein
MQCESGQCGGKLFSSFLLAGRVITTDGLQREAYAVLFLESTSVRIVKAMNPRRGAMGEPPLAPYMTALAES